MDLYRTLDVKGITPDVCDHIDQLVDARRRRLTATAFELGIGVGRCYSRAVDPMIQPTVQGSVR